MVDEYNNKSAQIVIIEPNKTIATYDLLPNEQYLIGRTGGPNDVSINSPVVTSQHGMFSYARGAFSYIDLGSTNGTYVNGRKISNAPRVPSSEVYLRDGDVLTIAPGDPNQISIIFSIGTGYCSWHLCDLSTANTISIGRNESSNIVIPNVQVSRNHAVVTNNRTSYAIRDLNSVNGTIVNGQMIRGSQQLKDGDIIQINSSRLVFTNGCIVYNVQNEIAVYSERGGKPASAPAGRGGKSTKADPRYDGRVVARKGGVEVQVKNVSRLVNCKKNTGINGSGKKKILDDISLTIHKGELVAILGGSGAGKTTFMNCINGFEGPTEGTVLIDGIELYKNYQSLKSRMGYVPQQDIVHDNLTLKDMLTYTGRLRLPRDDIKSTLDKRVNEVIEMVDLSEHRDTLIKKMSGGQRKRASIAVELLSDPQLMFLDEPTSGLDPEAETSLVNQLRILSDKGGKTVVVVTHSLQNIKLFDKVIFLAPGGKLCFYGTPEEASNFFGVENLTDAYRKILKDIDGYVKKYNASRQGV